jgi:esterase/lipase
MNSPIIVPKSEPFFSPGGRTGCLFIHGFTSMPDEMRLCGEYLSIKGYPVLGIRLAGHATHPDDLARIRWQDWLVSVEEGLAVLRAVCDKDIFWMENAGHSIVLDPQRDLAFGKICQFLKEVNLSA